MSMLDIFPINDAKEFLSTHSEFNSILFIGKPGTCKSSFLFQAAKTIAHRERGKKIIYITPEKLSRIPLHVHLMHKIDPSTARATEFEYIDNFTDLMHQLAEIHTRNDDIAAVIIDDFNIFATSIRNDYRDTILAFFALVGDTANFLSARYSCPFFLAINSEDEAEIANYYLYANQFIDEIWLCEKAEELDKTNAFIMKSNESNYWIHYFVEKEHIFTDRITHHFKGDDNNQPEEAEVEEEDC